MKRREWFFGGMMFLGFLGYYLLMKSLGLYTNTYLRIFNIIIHFGLVYLTLRAYKQSSPEKFNASNAILSGLRTTLVGVMAFIIFMVVYFTNINPAFLQTLQETSVLSEYLTPATASILLFTEGMLAGAFSSFIAHYMLRTKSALETSSSHKTSQRKQQWANA